MLEDEYFRSNYEVRSMLRVLFNSDAFKNARFAKVKSPVEAVIGTTRLVGDFTAPKPGVPALVAEMRYMGQDLANPPTVEGWHTGQEWIDSGTLVERINFTADQMGNTKLPGIRAIIDRLGAEGPTLSPERLVDGCLELLGHYETRRGHPQHAGGACAKGRRTAHRHRRLRPASGPDAPAHRIDPGISLCLRGADYGYA